MTKSLATAIRGAVKGMPWLSQSDQALVTLALAYADRIDAAIRAGDEGEATKALYLGPHLLNTLKTMGGSPAERKALGVEEALGGKLQQLRSVTQRSA